MPIYHPKLSTLIDASAIPGDFEKVEDLAQQGIDFILGDLRYTQLLIEHSPNGDTKFYSLSIIRKEMALPIGSEGLQLIFFKGSAGLSEIPIAMDWRHPIMRYIHEFEQQGFSYAPEAFFEIVLSMADVTKEEFINEIINVFINDPEPYVKFIQEIQDSLTRYKNNQQSIKDDTNEIFDNVDDILSELGNLQIDLQNPSNMSQPFMDEIDAITSTFEQISETLDIDFDVYQMAFEAFLGDIQGFDFDDRINQLIDLFQTWLGNITREDIEYLLIPQFGFELQNINMALEFPRKWLVPLDNDEQPITDINVKSSLIFTVGNLTYHTTTGFEFENENYADLTYSQIGKTGFTIKVIKLKADLSRRTNIAEANADGRPVEFRGVYCQEAIIGLPAKWFKEDDKQTLAIVGRNLLVGTGGISGIVGLEVKDSPGNPPADNETMDWTIGKNGKGFTLGFKKFNMEWYQDSLVDCEVAGYIEIPNFKSLERTTSGFNTLPGDNLRINIDAMFDAEGDFTFTAKPKRVDDTGKEHDWIFGIGDEGEVVAILVKHLKVVKDVNPNNPDEDKVYLEVTGAFDFSGNDILKSKLTSPIEVELRIYSDGSFELKNGSIPIPDPGPIQLGPVNLNITNISMGSEDINPKYKFISFDCAVNTGPAGVEAKGNGIALYFNSDGSDMFLKIKGIGIDITIPGTASEENAALILKGFLSMDEKEYIGGVAFALPKAKIKGGAAMRMKPKDPSFIVDAFLELPTAIPLGTLGIYGFRGLFGLRYVPKLPEGAITDPNAFFDYYDEEVENPINNQAQKGLHLGKFDTPEATGKASKPVSIGAGAIIGTLPDDGRTFSVNAFLFLCVPELLLVISGKANVLSERVSYMGDDPPFFAYLLLNEEYISVGMGADYKIDKSDGKILELDVEAKMAYFFRNPSAWYVHFGNDVEPIQARILKDIFNLNAYAYLMLSSQGISTGAGIKFEFSKKYGPVGVSAKAYVDVWAKMSFQQFQIGGGVAMGGSITASAFGISFYIGLDAYLTATAPKPFIVKGGVKVCVAVNLVFKKFEKCVDVEFCWEFNNTYNTSEIGVFKPLVDIDTPAGGFHLGSKQPYALSEFKLVNKNQATQSLFDTIDYNEVTTIPLDTQIDIQLNKAVDPEQLLSIGGFTNPAVENTEFVSPRSVNGKQVKHFFKATDAKILVQTPTGNWIDYHPYEVLDNDSLIDNSTVNLSELKLGYWQKKGKEYNNLKILSTQPFDFIDNMAGKVVPEELGITASTLFCETREKVCKCIDWDAENFELPKNINRFHKGVLFKVFKKDAFSGYGGTYFNHSNALILSNESKLEVYFKEEVKQFKIKMQTFVNPIQVIIYGYQQEVKNVIDKEGNVLENEYEIVDTKVKYEIIETLVLSWIDLVTPVKFSSNSKSIAKIEIIMPCYNQEIREKKKLEFEIERLQMAKLDKEVDKKEINQQLRSVRRQLASLSKNCCPEVSMDKWSKEIDRKISSLTKDLGNKRKAILELEQQKENICGEARELIEIRKCIQSNESCEKIVWLCQKSEKEKNNSRNNRLIKAVRKIEEMATKCCQDTKEKLHELLQEIEDRINESKSKCDEIGVEISNINDAISDINDEIKELEKRGTEIEDQLQLDSCKTYLYELCYTTVDDYIRSQSFPSQAAIEADYSHLHDANTQVIAPIWRPNQNYIVQINTLEKVIPPSGSPVEYKKALVIPFKTEGPIGHFDLENLPEEVRKSLKYDETPPSSPQTATPTDGSGYIKKIEVPENNIRYYLDESRCYPNIMGNISKAKPMYYGVPEVLLFFNDPFAKHFFSHWKAYNGLPARDSKLFIEIKDPAENNEVNNDDNQVKSINLPIPKFSREAKISWEKDENADVPQSLELINSLRNPKLKNEDFIGTTCWTIGGDPILPFSKYPKIEVESLKPSKLYNILLFNDYSKDNDGDYIRKQIHSYPFQTSRYSNLKAHIESYMQREEYGEYIVEDVVPEKKKAVFFVDNQEEYIQTKLVEIGVGIDEVFPSDVDQTFVNEFSDIYQRAIYGQLHINDLPNADNTEFNFITNKDDDIAAIWIRTAEPLNDPLIPYEEIFDSVELLVNNKAFAGVKRDPISLEQIANYNALTNAIQQMQNNPFSLHATIIYSADRCNMLIVPIQKLKKTDIVQIKFKYILWNGSEYVEKDSYTTSNLLEL